MPSPSGADGVQVILPYYFVPTVDGMLEHYKLLADELDIGMVIYNNPAFSGSWIKPAQMKKLIELTGDKIVAVKENTPHLMLFNGMAKALKGTGVKLLSGFGEQWYAYQFPWGADGLATPFGNFFPEYPIGFKKAADQYDFAAMREWRPGWTATMPLWEKSAPRAETPACWISPAETSTAREMCALA